MKVTKNGKIGKPAEWKIEILCRKKDKYDSKGCGAGLEISEQDLVLMYWRGTHFPHYYPAVKCPRCGKYNRINDIPAPIWKKLTTRRNQKKAIFDGFSDAI